MHPALFYESHGKTNTTRSFKSQGCSPRGGRISASCRWCNGPSLPVRRGSSRRRSPAPSNAAPARWLGFMGQGLLARRIAISRVFAKQQRLTSRSGISGGRQGLSASEVFSHHIKMQFPFLLTFHLPGSHPLWHSPLFPKSSFALK